MDLFLKDEKMKRNWPRTSGPNSRMARVGERKFLIYSDPSHPGLPGNFKIFPKRKKRKKELERRRIDPEWCSTVVYCSLHRMEAEAEAGRPRPAMSAEDERLLMEAKWLPWDERLRHKSWKVRRDANVDLAALCDSIADPKDARLREFGQFSYTLPASPESCAIGSASSEL